MQKALQSMYKQTVDSYEQFVTRSESELDETSRGLTFMRTKLEQEQRKTEALEHEKERNAEEL